MWLGARLIKARRGGEPPAVGQPRRLVLADDAHRFVHQPVQEIVRQPAGERLGRHDAERVDVAARVERTRIAPACSGDM
ncbi:MAG: hypothetical protein AAF297_00860 [Planctomycetota bacterium]